MKVEIPKADPPATGPIVVLSVMLDYLIEVPLAELDFEPTHGTDLTRDLVARFEEILAGVARVNRSIYATTDAIEVFTRGFLVLDEDPDAVHLDIKVVSK